MNAIITYINDDLKIVTLTCVPLEHGFKILISVCVYEKVYNYISTLVYILKHI